MTMRSVQDRFWSDGWVRRLNPLDRYLFLYLITNEHTNWAGVYELEIGMMAFESGIDRTELEQSMLPRLSPKVIYMDGWVYIPNWVKHHMSEGGTLSPQQKEGMRKAKDKIPLEIRRKIDQIENEGIPYAYPMVGVSPSSLSSSLSSITASPCSADSSEEFEIVKEDAPSKKEPNATKQYAALCDWLENLTGVKIVNRVKQYTHLKKAKAAGIDPGRLKARATELVGEAFYQEHGLDWGSIVSSFDRRA